MSGRVWMRSICFVILIAIAATLAGCMLFVGTQAKIDVTPTAGVVPLTIEFDATRSTGPGGITTYHWVFGNGDESYEATGTYTYSHAGNYTLSLTARAENGESDTRTITIQVDPAVWVTDTNLARIYKLDMDGTLLSTFNLPYSEPYGITTAELEGQSWIYVACYNGGNQKILRIDSSDGDINREFTAPAQSPRNLTFAADEPTRIWHVDAESRRIYGLNPITGTVLEGYGANYFKSTSPQVSNLPFLWTPQGLDWTPEPNRSGHLWYLEGENRLLYKIEIIPSYDIMSGTQLQIVGDPIQINVFSVTAIDIYEDALWVVNANAHEIVEIDLETGNLTGNKITGFPGATTAGLEIQH